MKDLGVKIKISVNCFMTLMLNGKSYNFNVQFMNTINQIEAKLIFS